MWPKKLPVKEITNADTQDAIKEAFFRIHLQKKFDWGTEETRGGRGGGGGSGSPSVAAGIDLSVIEDDGDEWCPSN